MPENQQNQSGAFITGGWGDMAIMGLVIVLILWILRRQTTIADNFTDRIGSVKTEVIDYKESWDTRRDGLLETFNRICHERQSACVGLVDQKLEGVEMQFGYVCRKFEEVKRDRQRRWEKQDEINEDVLRLKEGFGKT